MGGALRRALPILQRHLAFLVEKRGRKLPERPETSVEMFDERAHRRVYTVSSSFLFATLGKLTALRTVKASL